MNLKIITGSINSGKTGYLLNLVKKNIEDGKNVCGIASKKNDNDGYDAVIIKNNIILDPIPFIHRKAYSNSIFKNFHFDDKIFNEMEELSKGIYDTFILDEIGQLELKYEKGFYNIIGKLLLKKDINIIFSVKEKLIELFINRYNIMNHYYEKMIDELHIIRVY